MIMPDPIAVLRAGHRARPFTDSSSGQLLIAGATGALGQAVLRRLAGGRWHGIQVLALGPIKPLLRAVRIVQLPAGGPFSPVTGSVNAAVSRAGMQHGPPLRCDVAVVLFEPPRATHDRERVLWTPTPEQLPDLARWLHEAGAHTLAVVLPHDSGGLPQALREGLASIDEQQVAAIGFRRFILLRGAREPNVDPTASAPQRLARWMLGVGRQMLPQAQRPVRASAVAALLDAALALAPPGIHVAAPETVWAASQRDPRAVAAQWLSG